MVTRPRITTKEELDPLDQTEIVEGYRDGFNGFPCGDNRSDSYWHGWRNAMTDRGKMPKTDAQALLAHDLYGKQRKPRP